MRFCLRLEENTYLLNFPKSNCNPDNVNEMRIIRCGIMEGYVSKKNIEMRMARAKREITNISDVTI